MVVMDSTLRGLLWGFVTNVGILLLSFLIFLYVRWLRGDRSRGSLPLLRSSAAPLIGPVPPGVAHGRDRFTVSSPFYRQTDTNNTGRDNRYLSYDAADIEADGGGAVGSEDDPERRRGSRPVLYRTYTIDHGSHPVCGFASILWDIEVDQFFSMDVQFYLLFLQAAGKISWILTIFGLAVVLPINLTAPGPPESKQKIWLERASAGNVTADGWRIWVLYAATWVYSGVVYAFVFSLWRRLRKYRWTPSEHFTAEKFALMVSGISRDCIDSNVLREHFEVLHPGRVVSARLVLDYSALLAAKRKLMTYRKELERRLENQPHGSSILALEEEDDDNRTDDGHESAALSPRGIDNYPTYIAPLHPTTPTLTDDHLDLTATTKLSAGTTAISSQVGSGLMEDQLEAGTGGTSAELPPVRSPSPWRRAPDLATLETQFHQQSRFVARTAMLTPARSTGVGFVTFNSTATAAECLCDPRVFGMHYDWEVSRAPPPGDIIWSNIHISWTQCLIRTLALNIILFIFSIVLTSSALLTNWLIPLMENFEKVVHEADILKLSISGWASPLILFVVNSLILPFCVWWCATSSGHWRESSQAAAILNGNATFLVLNSLIFPILSTGSVWAVIDRMYHTEIQRWNIQMSVLIVTQSGSFAIKYLLNACFLSSSAQLLQIPQLVYRKVCQWIGKQEVPWAFDFGYHYAFCTSIFTLCFVLSVFLPPVLPLTGLFFLLKYWLDKYNFAFTVWGVDVDSAGAVTITALNYMIFAVTFMQFVMSGYFLKFGLGGDRYLTLAGALLFIASTMGGILQLGQFVNIGSFVKDWKPGVSQRERRARGAELEVLKLAYVHPCEKGRRRSSAYSVDMEAHQAAVPLGTGAKA